MTRQDRWVSKLSRTVLTNNTPPLSVMMFAKATEFFRALIYAQGYARLCQSEELLRSIANIKEKVRAVRYAALTTPTHYAYGYIQDKRNAEMLEIFPSGKAPVLNASRSHQPVTNRARTSFHVDRFAKSLEDVLDFIRQYAEVFTGFVTSQHAHIKDNAQVIGYMSGCANAWWQIAKHRRDSCSVKRIMLRTSPPDRESHSDRLLPLSQEKYTDFFRRTVYNRLVKASLISNNQLLPRDSGCNEASFLSINIVYSSSGRLPIDFIRGEHSDGIQVVPSIHSRKINLLRVDEGLDSRTHLPPF